MSTKEKKKRIVLYADISSANKRFIKKLAKKDKKSVSTIIDSMLTELRLGSKT